MVRWMSWLKSLSWKDSRHSDPMARGFESLAHRQKKYLLVQLVERWTVNPYVAGSSPA